MMSLPGSPTTKVSARFQGGRGEEELETVDPAAAVGNHGELIGTASEMILAG